MFDWVANNVGNIISIIGMFAVGIGFLYSMKDKIDNMSTRLLVLEGELKKLIDVLIAQGRQEERISALDQRMVAQGIRLDDLSKRFNNLTDKN